MRYYYALLATLLFTLTTTLAQAAESKTPALDKAHAWVLGFMVKKAPPGRKIWYEHGQETEEEALMRYNDVAWDIVELAYSKDTAPIFSSKAHGHSQMAAVWLGIMLHESGFTKHVDYNLGAYGRGDGGLSWCMMQMRIGSGTTASWNVAEDRQPWYGDNPEDIFDGYEGSDLILDRQKCIGEAHHLVRLSFKQCEDLPLLERLTAYTIGKCKVTRPEDPEDVKYVKTGKAKSRARMGSAIQYFAKTKVSRGFDDRDVVAELEALKSSISFVGPHEVKGFPMDRSLIRRLRTAAERGYTIANAPSYAKALGGKGTETSAAELLKLALGTKAEAVGSNPSKEETKVVEPVAPPETPKEVAEVEKAEPPVEDAKAASEGAPAEEPEGGPDYADMSKEDLYKVAQRLGISGRTKMDKEELLAAILEVSQS